MAVLSTGRGKIRLGHLGEHTAAFPVRLRVPPVMQLVQKCLTGTNPIAVKESSTNRLDERLDI